MNGFEACEIGYIYGIIVFMDKTKGKKPKKLKKNKKEKILKNRKKEKKKKPFSFGEGGGGVEFCRISIVQFTNVWLK